MFDIRRSNKIRRSVEPIEQTIYKQWLGKEAFILENFGCRNGKELSDEGI